MLGMLLRWMYAKHLMLLELSVCAAGALLYSIGKFGWMLLLGRCNTRGAVSFRMQHEAKSSAVSSCSLSNVMFFLECSRKRIA